LTGATATKILAPDEIFVGAQKSSLILRVVEVQHRAVALVSASAEAGEGLGKRFALGARRPLKRAEAAAPWALFAHLLGVVRAGRTGLLDVALGQDLFDVAQGIAQRQLAMENLFGWGFEFGRGGFAGDAERGL
jgi:hypothetical protein